LPGNTPVSPHHTKVKAGAEGRPKMPWYALYCRSSADRIVVDKLTAAGIEAFHPHAVERSRDGKREVERKFMPGYVFANFDLLTGTRAVIEIPQVVSILGWGRRPMPIPDFEIAAVRQIVQTPNVEVASDCPYVAAGDRVRVQRGPLRGLEGFVVFTKSGARVIVSVSMLARSISAEVDESALELIAPADLAPVAA
jgi:transcriptional antiterminator NusG